MTISAQVIDTIVEWIDDNLHQPLRIDDIARHAGYSKWHLQRLFYSTRGEPGALYSRRKLLLAARDLRDTDQRVYDICLKYGFDSQQTFTRLYPDLQSAAGRLPQKRTTVAPTEARLSGLTLEGKPATPHPAQHQILNGAQRKNHRQNSTV